MVLPCGSQVRIVAQVEAFGHGLYLSSDAQSVEELDVNIWEDSEVCCFIMLFLPLSPFF